MICIVSTPGALSPTLSVLTHTWEPTGQTMNHIINAAQPRSTLFTGSQRVAEKLAVHTRGQVRAVAWLVVVMRVVGGSQLTQATW